MWVESVGSIRMSLKSTGDGMPRPPTQSLRDYEKLNPGVVSGVLRADSWGKASLHD